MLSGDRAALLAPEDIIRLWSHENLRVYRDRLVNDDDRSWFDDLLKRLVPKFFSIEWTDVVKVDVAHLVYGDFMVPGADPKLYSEITDTNKMVRTPTLTLTPTPTPTLTLNLTPTPTLTLTQP